MKVIKHLAWLAVIVSATYLALILLTSLVPESVLGFNLAKWSQDVNGWADRYKWVLIALLALSLSLSRFRGTIRHVSMYFEWRYLEVVALVGLLLIVVSLVLGCSLGHIYLGSFLLAFSVLMGIFKLLKSSYPLPQGILEPDNAIKDKTDLAEDQATALDSLKSVLLNEAKAIRSIGLFGDWGSGKTTIYKACRTEVRDENIIWVDFEPWRYTSQESLTLGFYTAIGDMLEKQIPGLQNSTAKLLKSVQPFIDKQDKTGIISMISGFTESILSLNKDPEKYITKVLENSGKRLIIVIDDVERIYEADHIYRTLELAHFFKKSKFTTYIFISEKNKLLGSAPDRYKDDASEYLEKFIEYEINLPNPGATDLRRYMNKLLESRQDIVSENFNSSNDLFANLRTYRAVLKLFNQFIYGLTDNRLARNGTYMVKLEDKFEMDFIHVKYPAIWWHIQNHRALYVGKLRDQEWSMMYGFNEEKFKENRKNEITHVLKQYNVGIDSFVGELITSLFPEIGAAFDKSTSYKSLQDLLRKRSVAHPDVLDTYFAKSQSQEKYETQEKLIADTLNKIDKSKNEKSRVRILQNSFNKVGEDDISEFIVLLCDDILQFEDKQSKEYLSVLLKAYVDYIDYATHQTDNKLLRIIGTINIAADRIVDQSDKDEFIEYVFRDVENYNPHPTVSLRILLYIQPHRNNSFYSLKKFTGRISFAQRLLKSVDQYYLDLKQDVYNLPDGEWRFVIYQWAYSICDGPAKINDEIDKTGARYKKVMRYVYKMLQDPNNYIKLIEFGFYTTDINDDTDKKKLRIEKNLHPYGAKRLLNIGLKLRKQNISNKDETLLNEFIKELREYLKSQKNE